VVAVLDPLKSDDPLMAIYDNLDEYYHTLDSKNTTLSISTARGWNNRSRLRRGFSRCRVCKSKLMYELWKGNGFDHVCNTLQAAHPEIKNIRKYAQNVIRETTGDGIFDDYIVREKLWPVRKPIMAPPEIREQLELMWLVLEVEGRHRVETEKNINHHLKRRTRTGDLIMYAMDRARS
jgi:hypothetical protein